VPLARPIASAFAAVTGWGGPAMKFLVRYWIASAFFASGLTKVADFDATIFLFQTEYNVPLLPPELAAGSPPQSSFPARCCLCSVFARGLPSCRSLS
jgi:uncharacterized membrane protein YphA (DoxX/SURF4 family)